MSHTHMTRTKNNLGGLIIPAYILLQAVISALSGSFAFVLAGLAYTSLIIIVSLLQKGERRYYFFVTVSFFLLLYSTVCTAIQFVYIHDVFKNFYLGPDEFTFYSCALKLSKLSYSDIWHRSFTDFSFSDYPLFAAWIGSLQKICGLHDFYGLLFQKLNISFLSSFIPGCCFLLCSTNTENVKKSFLAALFYGFGAFTFYFSLGLLRDVHIALIYAIGLYVSIAGDYSPRNYILMAFLGCLAYFLRLENGLFFLAIIGAWVLRSGGRKKIIIGFLSIVALIFVIIKMGGVAMIFNKMLDTQSVYDARTVNAYGNTSSLGIKLMKLPFPLNYLGTTGLSQLVPFPFWSAFNNAKSFVAYILYLPYALAGLFWFSIWMRFLRNTKVTIQFFKQHKYIVAICLLYIILVASTEINARRLMAVYPVLFFGYFYISTRRDIDKKVELLYNTGIYAALILAYLALKL